MNYLIAGLGNIGPEYHKTRHNIGFDILDELAKQREISFKSERLADKAEFRFKSRNFHLIKPTTYMNLSGKSVKYWLDTLKIKQENLLVLVDDLALPLAQVRLKLKGGDGGHNGLKDIQEKLGNASYARLRFGIGNEFHKGQQVNFVLGKWNEDEEKELKPAIKTCTEAIISFATIGASRTMNQFNNKK